MKNNSFIIVLCLAVTHVAPSTLAAPSHLHMNEIGVKSLHLKEWLQQQQEGPSQGQVSGEDEASQERDERQRQQHQLHLDHLQNRETRHFDFVSRHPLKDLPHHEKLALDSEGNAHGFAAMDISDGRANDRQSNVASVVEATTSHVHYDINVPKTTKESPHKNFEAVPMDSQPMSEEEHQSSLKNRLYGIQQRLKKRRYSHEQKPFRHRVYGHLQLLKSRHYGEEQVTHQNDDTENTNDTNNNTKANQHKKDWKEAYAMFAIWNLDNLFWLVPFLAHSPLLVTPFFVTYQIVVNVFCFNAANIAHGMSFAEAYAQNILCGALSALFCWCLTVYYWTRYHQKEKLALLISSSNLAGKNSENKQTTENVDNDSDLEAPLLEKPAISTTEDNSLNHYYSSIQVQPTVWLTIGLTLLAAADDMSFVPVIVETQMFSVIQIQLSAMFAAAVVSTAALALSQVYENTLIRIPLYVVLFVFSNCVTGHTLWDYIVAPTNIVGTG